eukprot:g16681.t1
MTNASPSFGFSAVTAAVAAAAVLCLQSDVVEALSVGAGVSTSNLNGNAAETTATVLLRSKVVDDGDAPTAMFRKETMPGTPTSMIAIINLACQYFLIYASLAVARTAVQLSLGGQSMYAFQKLCESAATTINYAPMLCVLFLGARMRADQIAQGKTDEMNLPSGQTRAGMQVAANCVLGQLLCVLLLPLLTGTLTVPVDSEGNVDTQRLAVPKAVLLSLTALRYVFLAGLYGGAVLVVYGIHTMDIEDKAARDRMWPDGIPKVSPPVGATIFLTTVFFLLYSLIAVIKTYSEFRPVGERLTAFFQSVSLATFTVNMAPMLCILFIGARMRALQMDPVGGKLPEYAQYACWGCSGAVVAQVVLILALPFVGKGVTAERGDFEGDVKFKGLTGPGAIVLTALRYRIKISVLLYAALLSVYGGFTAVCYAVFTMTPNDDPAATPPPLSPALLCVMNLVAQYFFIYGSIFVLQTIRTYSDGSPSLKILHGAIENARMTVMYAPMLSVLFVAVRMRALQLARTTANDIPKNAGPPTYAQECMFLATWSVLVQILLVVVMSFSYTVELDEEGNVKPPKNVSRTTGYVLSSLRYASLVVKAGSTSNYNPLSWWPSSLGEWKACREFLGGWSHVMRRRWVAACIVL